jgi:hypothetical protein
MAAHQSPIIELHHWVAAVVAVLARDVALLAHRENLLQRETPSLSGHGGHRSSRIPFNFAEAAD